LKRVQGGGQRLGRNRAQSLGKSDLVDCPNLIE